MTKPFRAAMVDAGELMRAGRLSDAVSAIQKTLSAESAVSEPRAPTDFFGAILPDLQDAMGGMRSLLAFGSGRDERKAEAPDRRFKEAVFSGPVGTLPYKLYVPDSIGEAPRPLVVMLHGCTQSPDDFAAGTRMNALAERDGFLVCYPGQTAAANGRRCWNWFNAGDQRRDRGEPALVAGITRAVMAAYRVDPSRVYVAGLSAGGALAATMGQAYPDLFAAVGVHSGLACGAAHDVASAFAAMRQGAGPAASRDGAPSAAIPTIVFHGDRDATVSPINAEEVAAQVIDPASARLATERGRSPGGRAYRRTLHREPGGRVVVERWLIEGAGHAWSGGDPAGSFTDPQGPDASGEMLRFFSEHPGPSAPAR